MPLDGCASTVATEPDNGRIVGYLRGRIDELSRPYDLPAESWS